MRAIFFQIKTRFMCGDLNCIAQCGCDTMIAAHRALSLLTEDELELLKAELCPSCPTGGPITPSGPGGGPSGDCFDRLHAEFCSEGRIARAQAAIVLLNQAAKLASLANPELSLYALKFVAFLQASIDSCAGDGAQARAALARVCATWPTISKLASFSSIPGIGTPLNAMVFALLTPQLKAVLNECCSKAGSVGVPALPPPTQGLPQLPEPGTRVEGTPALTSPIGAAFAQQALPASAQTQLQTRSGVVPTHLPVRASLLMNMFNGKV